MKYNSFKVLAAYFGSEKPLAPKEFLKFWNSLTTAERDYYRTADLSS